MKKVSIEEIKKMQEIVNKKLRYEYCYIKHCMERGEKITIAGSMDYYKKDAMFFLRKNLRAGMKVYMILRHVSSSGMYRSISFFYCQKNAVISLDYYLSKIGMGKIDKHGGIGVGGCGMDMGAHVVMSLSRLIFDGKSDKPDYQLSYIWM